MKKQSVKLTGTPYDDVFRTLLNDCSSLILPLLYEIFQETYSGEEQIVFERNEHFMNQQDGAEEERITDSCFEIIAASVKKYHVECQSTEDSTILIRFFEYDSQIALDDGVVKGDMLRISFPHSAVLYLRSHANTPDHLTIHMETPGGTIEYPIYVMKCQEYSLKEIFDKNLLFLIPFYIFSHESRFEEYEENTDKLQELKQEYALINQKLEELCIHGVINEYTKHTLIDMSKKVLEHIAAKKKNIREGVKEIMGGKVLEYEAKTILKQGETKKLIRQICIKRKKGNSPALIAENLEEDYQTVDEICGIAENYAPDYDFELVWQAYMRIHKQG